MALTGHGQFTDRSRPVRWQDQAARWQDQAAR
jgi:hypothetical protein